MCIIADRLGENGIRHYRVVHACGNVIAFIKWRRDFAGDVNDKALIESYDAWKARSEYWKR